MGSDYSENMRGFLDAIVPLASGKEIRILLLPIAYSIDPMMISEGERNQNLRNAEEQQSQIEADCQQYISPGSKCIVTLIPIFVRSDTNNEDVIKSLESQPTAILILGDKQNTAMQTLADTPVEIALSRAYQNGVVIAGADAGAAIQSTSMIAGFSVDFKVMNSLNFGASNVWNTPQERGLSFGLQDAIAESHIHEQNRLGRLLNAITLPNTPHLGIGIDVETGIKIENEDRLEDVFGQNTITILDAETYHSADAVQYQGSEHLLSLRNVLLHVLSPGKFTYSLQARKHSLAPIQDRIERQFKNISLPSGVGSIIVSNNLYKSAYNNPILTRFINMSGGKKANILIVTVGFSDDEVTRKITYDLIDALNVSGQSHIESLHAVEKLKVSKDTTGIILVGSDQSRIQPQSLDTIQDAWLSGTPLLIDGSASALIGKYFSAPPTAPNNDAGKHSYFHLGDVEIFPGLSILNLNIEPQVQEKNRWGQFFSLAYQNPEILALGLAEGAALEFTSNGATALGNNVVISLDLSEATLDVGANQGFVIANGLLDVFTPGELVEPESADIDFEPVSISTPSISAATSTPLPFAQTPVQYPTPSPAPSPKSDKQSGLFKGMPTKTPQKASAPQNILPADPNLARLIIGAGILIVVVVILGVWINRYRLR